MNNKISSITKILAAYMACFALMLLLGISVRNPLTLAFFICAVMMENRSSHMLKGFSFYASWLISLIISALITILSKNRFSLQFDSKLFQLLSIAIVFVGMTCVIKISISFLVSLIRGNHPERTNKPDADNKTASSFSDFSAFFSKKLFIMPSYLIIISCMVIIFLCYLPYFLYEFPGIMTADSLVQYEQIIGLREYSNHHPIVHTLAIGLFYKIGMLLTNNANRAISFYTLAQMMFISYCEGRAVLTVCKITSGKHLEKAHSSSHKAYCVTVSGILALLFFAIVPFNAVFAVTIWKDIPFAGIALLFVCYIYDLISKSEDEPPGEITILDYVKGIVLSILFCLFRSNALFAFIILAPLFVYIFRDRIKDILFALVIVLAAFFIIKGPVMKVAGISQPDFTESLSLPISQIARVLVDDKEVSDDDLALIDAVIDRTYIHELYAPNFADNMKELVRAGHPEVLEKNKATYLELWLRLFFKHPAQYLKAWFDLEGGYIYPDVDYEVGNIDGIMTNSLGLVSTPLIGGKLVVKTKEILIKLGSFLPVYGLLWCAGTYTLLHIFFAIFIIKNKKGKKYIVLPLVSLALILTLLIAAPVVDFRYAYAAVLTMPVCASLLRKG